jgi:aminoglycoside 6'-N-acetyltransferase I
LKEFFGMIAETYPADYVTLASIRELPAKAKIANKTVEATPLRSVPHLGRSTKEMRIRHPEAKDAGYWLHLRRHLWPLADNQSDIDAFFSKESHPHSTIFVAESDDGTVCGFLEVSIRHEYVEGASSSPIGYLEGWFVLPNWRGLGIGKQLVRQAELWVVASGCYELASDSLADNNDSIAAHVSCGFAPVSTIVHLVKKLPPDHA